ncbi:hypothetical protein ACQKM9_04825 [Viridibacillus sp. NPDC093762]|uniref:hypothetical protein n=1 Tax=Viridibacillus sp. NPDC093762 TaxID=3390720 RepID=UPI003CFDADCE
MHYCLKYQTRGIAQHFESANNKKLEIDVSEEVEVVNVESAATPLSANTAEAISETTKQALTLGHLFLK